MYKSRISKLFSFLMGFAGFGMGVVEDGGGGASSESLDTNSAADAFSSLLGSDDPTENESQDDESPEAAAERLAKQELSGEDEDPPDEGESESEPEPDGVTVEIDGKTVKLTKEQIAENYKNGLRQQDYTRKTMETAEARKTAEAEVAKARQERQQYANQLNNYAAQMAGGINEQAALLTQELWDSDPHEYLSIERTVKQRQANLAQAQQELTQINQIQQQEQLQSQAAYIATQRDQLLAKLPEWSDPKKATAEQASIKEYLSKQGFEPQEMGAIADHRLVILSRKAMQYDALIDRAGKAVKKVAALPVKAERSGTPETSTPNKRTEAVKRLGRSGSIADAANAFNQIF